MSRPTGGPATLGPHFYFALQGYEIAYDFDRLGCPAEAAEVRAEADALLDLAWIPSISG